MATTSTAAAPRSAGLSARDLFAGIAGNVMEWYDFAVYGYFASTIGRLFFPDKDPTVSLLAAFGVFAGGYLMRPLGGLVFGHVGDRLGRRRALTISSLLMGLPTALIGFMPTYEQIGLWAPAGMLLLRLLQGLSVGGEYTSSAVFVVEHAPARRRGFYGSWVVWGSLAGIVIGSGTAALLTSVLSAGALARWGWRVAFVAGIVIATYTFALRRGLAAEPQIVHAPDERPPIVEAVRHHWRAMLQGAGLSLGTAVSFYTLFVYLVTYMELIDRLPAARALDINTVNMIVMLVLLPVFGWLSDRIGRKTLAIGSAVVMAVTARPLFGAVHSSDSVSVFLGQLGFAVVVAAYASLVPTLLVEAFPRDVRCSAVSTSYNLVLGLFGGTAPIFATYLIQRTHDDVAPAYYIMASAIVAAVAIATMKPAATVE